MSDILSFSLFLTYFLLIDILAINKIRKGMTTVTISPKYQIVIPKEIREKLKLKPGQKLQIIQVEDKIEFITIKSVKEARGFLKGIDTTVEREKDRL